MLRRLFARPAPAPVPTIVRGPVEEQIRAFGRSYDDAMKSVQRATGAILYGALGKATEKGAPELMQIEAAARNASLSIDNVEGLWLEGHSALTALRAPTEILLELCDYARAMLRDADDSSAGRTGQPTFDTDGAQLHAILARQAETMREAQYQLLRAGVDLQTILGEDWAYEHGLQT